MALLNVCPFIWTAAAAPQPWKFCRQGTCARRSRWKFGEHLNQAVFLLFSSHARTRVSRWKPCSRRPPDVWPFLFVAHSPSHDKRVSTLLLRTATTKTPSWGRKMTQHCIIITVFLNDCWGKFRKQGSKFQNTTSTIDQSCVCSPDLCV